jgi:F0F1-type ATP synthase assembly protein I
MPQPRDANQQNWGRYFGIGLEIALGVGIGYVVGAWLDRRYGWTPWGVIAGTMIGLAAGLYLLIKEALRMNKD